MVVPVDGLLMTTDHLRIAVVGASGGLGASTFSVALAARASRVLGLTACVDAALAGGGLDVTACVEHRPGLRWGDLASANGDLDGAALLRALPGERLLRLLSAGGHGVGAGALLEPPPPVVRAALAGVASVCGVTVLDVPVGGDLWLELLEGCDRIVVLVGLAPRQLADAAALADRLVDGPPQHLVVRASRRHPDLADAVAERLGIPLLAEWRDDAQVASDALRGVTPGERDDSPLTRLCHRALEVTGALADAPGPVSEAVGVNR